MGREVLELGVSSPLITRRRRLITSGTRAAGAQHSAPLHREDVFWRLFREEPATAQVFEGSLCWKKKRELKVGKQLVSTTTMRMKH